MVTNMTSILEDLFQWANGQLVGNRVTVDFAMTTNNQINSNQVTYAIGTLAYTKVPFTPSWFANNSAEFSSSNNGITQYFSDRHPSGSPTIPFDPKNTEAFDVKIVMPNSAQTYFAITIKSSSINLAHTFNPSFDPTAGVILGSIVSSMITISLCNRLSNPIPK